MTKYPLFKTNSILAVGTQWNTTQVKVTYSPTCVKL